MAKFQYAGFGFGACFTNSRATGVIKVSQVQVEFTSPDGHVAFPLQGLEIKNGGASDANIFFSHPHFPEITFYTTDKSIYSHPAISTNADVKSQVQKVKSASNRKYWLAGVAIAIVVAIPFLFISMVTSLSGVIATQIPVEWEEVLGEGGIADYQTRSELYGDQVSELLDPLVEPLLAAIASDRYQFRFYVAKDESINAFALPGGFIVIHDGLIRAADTPEELLGVVAHEIAHVVEQHGVRNVISTAGSAIIISALLGDQSGILALFGDAVPMLLSQSYSRSFESAADEVGAHLMIDADINPAGLVAFFETMLELQAGVEPVGLLSSHPATSDRINDMSDYLELGHPPFLELTDQFDRLKSAVSR